jgi:hypothetical protein
MNWLNLVYVCFKPVHINIADYSDCMFLCNSHFSQEIPYKLV